MKKLNYLIILAVLTIFTIPVISGDKANLSDVITKYEREILENVQKSDFRKSIVAAAEYEQELISMYPPASFQNDLFQCESDHMTFHSSFTDWKRVGLKELEIPEWLPMMGFNILLALEGKVEDDRFIAISMNMGQIEQRMGLAEPGKAEMSDQELLLGATLMAGQFGVVKNQEFKTIGNHRTLVLYVGTPMGGPPITMVNLAHGRRFYSFVLLSSLRNRQDNEKKMFEFTKTIDFKYKPAQTDKIKAIRDKHANKDALQSVLKCVGELSEIGEYNAAAEELARLRILLSQRMQKPLVKGNVAEYPAYGVSLTNPNDKKWKLSIEDTGPTKMLLLEDRWSVKGEGMAILILDIVLAYGPQAAKVLEDKEQIKQLLIGGGRGSALSIGTAIENERFTTIKENFAYEAVVTTNMPGLKVKCMWMMRPGFMLGILMMADANAFQEKTQEYEKIIQRDFLKIGD